MTIRELCVKNGYCCKCPFYKACILLDCNAPFGYDENDDKTITKSIIETAKILTGSNINGNENKENL